MTTEGVARRAADPGAGEGAEEAGRLRTAPLTEEQIEARRNHAHGAIVRGLEAKLTAAVARAEAAERERNEARAKAAMAFAAVCEARGYEALCGNPTGLANHLIAAGKALGDIITPALAAQLGGPARQAATAPLARDGGPLCAYGDGQGRHCRHRVSCGGSGRCLGPDFGRGRRGEDTTTDAEAGHGR